MNQINDYECPFYWLVAFKALVLDQAIKSWFKRGTWSLKMINSIFRREVTIYNPSQMSYQLVLLRE